MATVVLRARQTPHRRIAERPRPRTSRPLSVNLAAFILTILALIFGCLLYVQGRTMVIHERYRLQRAQQEQDRIGIENRKLRLAWATLTSPRQLEEAARRRFGLHSPTPKEVVRLP